MEGGDGSGKAGSMGRSLRGWVVHGERAKASPYAQALHASLGKRCIIPCMLHCVVQVAVVERTPHDEVLVLATDGLWDVFTCKVGFGGGLCWRPCTLERLGGHTCLKETTWG